MHRGSRSLSDHHIQSLLSIATRTALRWCRSAPDAEDVAQEAVLRLLEQEALPENAHTWLFVVTRRLATRSRMRELARLRAEETFAAVAPAQPRPDVLLDVGRALTTLGPRDRRLLLRVAEGVLSNDIAAEFGCHVRDVGQMVARARRKARNAANRGQSLRHDVRKQERRGT